MIQRIYTDNFRCLGNFEFRPDRLNLLLGDNGSGKTGLFEVLQLLKEIVLGGRSANELFAGKKTVWDRREIQSFELEIEDAGGTFSYRLEIRHPLLPSPLRPQIERERLDWNGRPLFRYSEGKVRLFDDDHSSGPIFPFKPESSFLLNLESQSTRVQSFKTFLAGIHVFQLNPFALDPSSQTDEKSLHVDGSNFVSWLRYLNDEQPEAKLECEKRLAEIVPGFQRFRFLSAGDRKLILATLARGDGEKYELPFASFSEGQRMLAILYSLLYGLVGPSSVLCLDEPENFLSLAEVQPWLQHLRDLVEERSGQALLISHHPEVIDYLAADSVFRFERPSGDLVRVSPWSRELRRMDRRGKT